MVCAKKNPEIQEWLKQSKNLDFICQLNEKNLFKVNIVPANSWQRHVDDLDRALFDAL